MDRQASEPPDPVDRRRSQQLPHRIRRLRWLRQTTPGKWGHVYKTTDGGGSFADISQGLPDVPVNSIVLDASYPDTLYAGTDVGPYVTYNGGGTWQFMGGTGFPIVGIWQLDLDPSHGTILAGTHGRGAFGMEDLTGRPALVVSKVDAGVPVGPKSTINYTLTVKNIGNGVATNVVVTDPVPANTTSPDASADGGTVKAGTVSWTVPSIAPGAEAQLHFSVSIRDALKKKVTSITNDGVKAVSAEGIYTTGSPFITSLADAYKVELEPACADGRRPGRRQRHLQGLGHEPWLRRRHLQAVGEWRHVPRDSTRCRLQAPVTTTSSLNPGETREFCVNVDVDPAAAGGATS